MATGGSLSETSEETEPKSTTDDEVTCSLCLDDFKDPRILPCFHTYCKLCLDELIKPERCNGKFLCPLCRTLHYIPKEDGNGFPSNYYMTALMKNINPKTEACSICADSSIEAIKMCLDCDQSLCQTCLNYHLKLTVTKSHRIASLSEKGKMEKTSYCLKHKTEILRFFCKECNVAICRDCKLTIHEGHFSVDIEDVSREALLRISDLITDYNSHVEELKNSDKFLVAYEKDIDGVSETAKSNIEVCINEICNEVKRSGKLVQDDIERRVLVKMRAVQDIRKDVQKRMQASRKVVEHIEQVKKVGSTADIINTQKAFDKMIFKENELTVQEELAFPKWTPPDVVNINLGQKPSFQFKDAEWIPHHKCIDANMIQCFYCPIPANQNIISICPVSDDHVLVLFGHRFGHLHNFGFWPFRRANILEIHLGKEILEYCSLPNVRDITYTNTGNGEVICYDAVAESFLVQPLHAKEQDCVKPSEQKQNEDPQQNTSNNRYHSNNESEVISLSCDRKEKIAVLYSSKLVEILSVSKMNVIQCQTLSNLSRPTRISCNANGYYCVADSGKEKVLVFDDKLKFLTELAVPFAYGQFSKHPHLPSDVCCDSEGAIYVSDIRNNCVLKFVLDSSNQLQVTVSLLKMKTCLDNPLALAIDSKNRLWVGDHNNRVCVFEM